MNNHRLNIKKYHQMDFKVTQVCSNFISNSLPIKSQEVKTISNQPRNTVNQITNYQTMIQGILLAPCPTLPVPPAQLASPQDPFIISRLS
jgi:hypothetical protein